MINNEVLKRVRYILALNEEKLVQVFKAAEFPLNVEQLEGWLAKDGAKQYKKLEDVDLATFLNGLINYKRGKKKGTQPQPEQKVNNNIILKKLKIAFNMKNEDVLRIMSLSNFLLGPHELTALLRKKTHKHFRICKDEVLVGFLNGLKIEFRDEEQKTTD